MKHQWKGAVIFSDVSTWDQVGPAFIGEVIAEDKAEAMRELRRMAWDQLDSRINDVTSEIIHMERIR